MGNKVQDILFDYLRDVIYSPEKAQLNIDDLPPEFHDFGEGLVFLGQCVKEQKAFGKSLIKGDFEHNIPDVENGIAAPLKEVHGILKHLVWQSHEVAKGDYSQRLAYFGELSESFNSMIEQLKEREDNLKAKNRELSNMREMFKSITEDASYYIFTIRRIDGEVIYLNKKGCDLREHSRSLYKLIYDKIISCEEDTVISIDDENAVSRPYHYQVFTKSKLADEYSVYMVMNITDEFSKTQQLEILAFVDELTGLHNRRYGQDVMEQLNVKKKNFALGFVDIDHLKYCNDVFGHEKGDEYISLVCDYIKSIEGEKTVCRVGGDEFIVIKPGETKESLEHELECLRQKFIDDHREPFQRSFSFGVSECSVKNNRDISGALEEADQNMYKYKITHKEKIEYDDNRM